MSMRSAKWLLAAATGGVVATAGAAGPGSHLTIKNGVAVTAYPEMIEAANYRSAGRHKILVDAIRAATTKAVPASQRIDYGAFQMLEVDEATARRLIAQGVADSADSQNLILLNAGVIDTTTDEAKAAARAAKINGKGMSLVHFAGPIRPEWYAQLQATGATIVTAIPNNAFLVYGTAEALQNVSRLSVQPAVQLVLPYQGKHRIDPAIRVNEAGKVTVQLINDPTENAATEQLIASLSAGGQVRRWESLNYVNIEANVAAGSVLQIADRPDVVSLQPFVEPQLYDERQDRIITGNISGNDPTPGDHLAWLASKGFTQSQFDTSGFVVDVTDSGIDVGAFSPPATQNTTHFGLRVGGVSSAASRVTYARLEGTPHSPSVTAGKDGHGTLNAHIIGGYVPGGGNFAASPHADAQGFRYGLGVAPFVRVGSSVIFDPDTFTSPNIPNLAARAYQDNARISSNSWGANTGGGYNANAQAYDGVVRDAQQATSAVPVAGNQEMVVIFAAGNAGPGVSTVGAPGSAKNVLTAGASENVHPFGGADICGIGDTGADSANDIISFSSRGPVAGGRKKPDLMAPGTHVTGGLWQASVVDPTGSPAPIGVASPTFAGDGVCAGVDPNLFFPTTSPQQQWYTASSGTSHSTPAIAGGAALLRQFFINNSLTPPSPAMTKAFLMSSARYMTGVSANDTLFSNNQGMGLMDLGRSFDGIARVLRDQVAGDIFTASGQDRTVTAQVVDAAQPVRITLAWTDAPGPTTGAPQLNNLDLEVTVGGQTYRGNNFTGANSSPGGSFDPNNNVESVFLPPQAANTPMVIRVIGANITADGVPNFGGVLDQDFALVVYNAVAGSFPVVARDSLAQTAENFVPINNVPDPGEQVSFSMGLRNVGSADATNVTATLQATGGVTLPSAPVNYGTLNAGGSATTGSFDYTVDPALSCGAPVTMTWNLTSGATSLGSVSQSVLTGQPTVGLTQNFDGVSAPALPAGWTANTVSGTPWASVTTQANSAPNSVFADDPASITDKSIESPAFPVSVPDAEVRFFHRFALENTFDGAVLEVKIGAADFADLVSAGGSFVQGGYNATISTQWQSPIAGRAAWSGSFNSAWQEVIARLPASAAGQNVQLRWRVASDTSVASTGYFLDDVRVVNGRACAIPAGPTADLGITATNGLGTLLASQAVSYTITVTNAGPSNVTGAILNVPVPAGLGNITWTCATTGTASCNGASGTGAIAGKTIDLNSGASATITYNATVDAGATGSINLTATIAAPSGTTDLATGNNSASDSDPVVTEGVFSHGFENPIAN